MAGKPTPRGSWGDWAIIEYKRKPSRVSCAMCIHYLEDRSCAKKPIVISEVGYDYWIICDSFELSGEYDNPETREKVHRIKRANSKAKYSNKPKPTSVENYIQYVDTSKSNANCLFADYHEKMKAYICRNTESALYKRVCRECSSYKQKMLNGSIGISKNCIKKQTQPIAEKSKTPFKSSATNNQTDLVQKKKRQRDYEIMKSNGRLMDYLREFHYIDEKLNKIEKDHTKQK